MPSIETNIALNSTEKQYYQRFVNLSVNEEPLPQGDATIRITPFDDFFLFTFEFGMVITFCVLPEELILA